MQLNQSIVHSINVDKMKILRKRQLFNLKFFKDYELNEMVKERAH